MTKIYLDYNATAPVRRQVIAMVADAMGMVGNASSVHGFGRAARKYVEDARGHVAALTGVRAMQVIFNSGATEGNNTILSGYQDKPILAMATEHPAVLQAAPHATLIPVTKDGLINMAVYETLLAEIKPALVCVQYVNSETGVIQPVKDIAALAHKHGALIHCDAVQAAGRINIDFKDLDVDTMALSAHKMAGPQGVGAIIFRDGLQLPKLLLGGGQERRQRAGTENVAGIAGFGVAAEIAKKELDHYQNIARLRDHLEQQLKIIASDIVIYGADAQRVANTTNIGLPGIPAQTQLMSLDLAGIAVSSGSACSSGAFKPSHVLMAMGASEDESKCTLRFSLGWATTDAEINAALAAYKDMVQKTRS